MQDREVHTGTNLQKILISVFFGAILALGSCCLLLLLCSAMVAGGIIPQASMPNLCMILMGLCALLGGRFAVKRGEGAPLLLGSMTGVVLCLLLFGISFLSFDQPSMQGGSRLLLLSALLGSILASFAHTSRRAKGKKRKKR